jgi:hypothetical protein
VRCRTLTTNSHAARHRKCRVRSWHSHEYVMLRALSNIYLTRKQQSALLQQSS